VLIAAIVGAVIWLAEDFGEIFTGQGTDPNSGLLLIIAAAAFWPFADVPPREADHARPTSATPRTDTLGFPRSAGTPVRHEAPRGIPSADGRNTAGNSRV
jgi:hypothetical protein